MHLLAAQPGAISDGSAAVDLGQTPADIVVLSAADSEIACLAAANAQHFLRYAASLIGRTSAWREPAPLLRAGLYWPGGEDVTLDDIRARWQADAPVAAIVFYRALVQAANTALIDALIAALAARGLNPLPLFALSLKDPQSAAILGAALEAAPPDIVLNGTGFAVAAPGEAHRAGPFDAADCPVLQIIYAGSDEASWRGGTRRPGAPANAMNRAPPAAGGALLPPPPAV